MDLKGKLVNFFKKAGLEENVEFKGFIDEMKKYTLLKSSKIFLPQAMKKDGELNS